MFASVMYWEDAQGSSSALYEGEVLRRHSSRASNTRYHACLMHQVLKLVDDRAWTLPHIPPYVPRCDSTKNLFGIAYPKKVDGAGGGSIVPFHVYYF
eukprot:scaffold68_cov340-Pavlova_lutheri.AAC.45